MFGRHAVHNILINLAELEHAFIEEKHGAESMDMLDSYRDYFSHEFIRSNRLMDIYWPQVSIPEHNMSAIIGMVDEATAIANHLNVAILKKFSFSSLSPHATTFFELQYMYQGEATLHWNGKAFRLREGDCFVTMPGVPFYFDHCPDGILIHIMLRRRFLSENYMRLFRNEPVALAFFGRVVSNFTEPQYLLFHAKEIACLNDLILAMFDEYLNHSDFSNEALESLLALFCTCLKKNEAGYPECSVPIEPMEAYYQTIVRYLQLHYQTARLEDLASELHFSKQYICRIIRAQGGKSFSGLLKEYRVSAVKDYLENTALSMEIISELTGFSDAAHLSRVFKEVTGQSPTVYRRNANCIPAG